MKILIFLTSIITLSQSVTFTCRYSIGNPRAIIGSVYECNPIVVHTTSGTVLENVTGTHLENKTNADVEFLYIVSQNLTYVPSNIEKFFPNLKGIHYYVSNLGQISASDLKPFPQLLLFYVHTGFITRLDADLFKYTPNLEWLGFFRNKIEHVGVNLIGNLTRLQHIHLGENVCVDTVANRPDTIVELNQQLPIMCPPYECDGRLWLCENQVSDQSRTISELLVENQNLQQRIDELEDKIRAVSEILCSL